jgi:hypothetical protein
MARSAEPRRAITAMCPAPICLSAAWLDSGRGALTSENALEDGVKRSFGARHPHDHRSSDFMIIRRVVEITKVVLYPVSQITEWEA